MRKYCGLFREVIFFNSIQLKKWNLSTFKFLIRGWKLEFGRFTLVIYSRNTL